MARMGTKLFGKGGRLAGLRSVAFAVKGVTGGQGPALTDRLAALPRLGRAVSAGEYHGVSAAQIGMMVAAATYIASPVDLLPEALLGVIGLADDAVVISWFAGMLVRVTDDFLAWEKARDTTIDGERVR